MRISDIEKLDALGREKGLVIYSIHQANAGWGCQWYVGSKGQTAVEPEWRTKIVVHQYYPTIAEMIEAETKRVNEWSADAD